MTTEPSDPQTAVGLYIGYRNAEIDRVRARVLVVAKLSERG